MSDAPSPESLALILRIFCGGDCHTDEEYACWIDAYIAERTDKLNSEHAAMCAYVSQLRATADAMAEALENYALNPMCSPLWGAVRQRLAAYRALSPAGEGE